jgi:pimeloyl-ACP methyl ester carboxylesterase
MELDGMAVHYRDVGPRDDREPLVLLHGTSASLHTWEGWASALQARHRVISVDLPGFGLTGPNANGDYRGDSYAQFVLRLLDALHVGRCALAGNSLGGEVAWRTAALSPARVSRLILVDASGYDFTPAHVPLGFRLARAPGLGWIVESLTPRSVIEASVRDVYGEPSKVTPALVDRYYELSLREGNRAALVQRLRQLERGADAQRIAQLRQPTLILWGGRDRLIPPDNARRFANDIRGSRLVVFDELGHVPQEEDPQRTVAVVRDFLEGR